ncbi:DUF1697 domain-containing protein [Candidatus Woesearchaeota archaeon]|nr:MAG: DUF1697 domain-containing protein [Candidatus Woesearchaeota archaeon]
MKFVALLRGVNVGGSRKVEMKRLKSLFESLRYRNVTTYVHSGNVMFESDVKRETLQNDIPKKLKKEFGFAVQALVKTKHEIKNIADAIPQRWKNDAEQKTDVAFLFPAIDSKNIVDALPVKKEFIDVRYVKGALIWNVRRTEYNKSRLNKIIGLKQYQYMTVRNVTTVRFLAGEKKTKT